MKYINPSIIESAMTYEAYRQLVSDLLAEGKSTGENQSEAFFQYSKLNVARMNRLDKKTVISEEANSLLQEIKQPLIWLVITEGWCGDAAQILPVIAKLADSNSNIELRHILRDEHLDIMDAFLTNGGRSIPKLIALDAESLKVLGSWGPRPELPQQMVMNSKKTAESISDKKSQKEYLDEVKKEVQLWYHRDKTKSIQMEVLNAVLSFVPEAV